MSFSQLLNIKRISFSWRISFDAHIIIPCKFFSVISFAIQTLSFLRIQIPLCSSILIIWWTSSMFEISIDVNVCLFSIIVNKVLLSISSDLRFFLMKNLIFWKFLNHLWNYCNSTWYIIYKFFAVCTALFLSSYNM